MESLAWSHPWFLPPQDRAGQGQDPRQQVRQERQAGLYLAVCSEEVGAGGPDGGPVWGVGWGGSCTLPGLLPRELCNQLHLPSCW